MKISGGALTNLLVKFRNRRFSLILLLLLFKQKDGYILRVVCACACVTYIVRLEINNLLVKNLKEFALSGRRPSQVEALLGVTPVLPVLGGSNDGHHRYLRRWLLLVLVMMLLLLLLLLLLQQTGGRRDSVVRHLHRAQGILLLVEFLALLHLLPLLGPPVLEPDLHLPLRQAEIAGQLRFPPYRYVAAVVELLLELDPLVVGVDDSVLVLRPRLPCNDTKTKST